MAAKRVCCLAEAMGSLKISAVKQSHAFNKVASRSMATEAPTRDLTRSASNPQSIIQSWTPISTVPLTIHNFPYLEPKSLEQWSVQHLYLPLRRDLLHLAVVYEGDITRQGTASAKTRYEVHGSHRKIRPQKGTGRARAGTRQSPLFRGGGKTFGPHPRDFGTKLNKKVYDRAWRTALSYRYRRGELIICEDGMELTLPRTFTTVESTLERAGLRDGYIEKYAYGFLENLGLGKANGRTLFVTGDRRPGLYDALERVPREAQALEMEDVDVKDLLETGQVVMERSALRELIQQHQSDLVSKVVVQGFPQPGPLIGHQVLGS